MDSDWRVSANYKFVGKDSTYVIMFEKDVQHIEKVIQKGVCSILRRYQSCFIWRT
jgi:hypothetical protein